MTRMLQFAARLWAGFQRLFGLNTCTTAPPPQVSLDPAQRRTRDRLQGLLKRD